MVFCCFKLYFIRVTASASLDPKASLSVLSHNTLHLSFNDTIYIYIYIYIYAFGEILNKNKINILPFAIYSHSKYAWPWPLKWVNIGCKYANQKATHDVLGVDNSNFCPICYRLLDLNIWPWKSSRSLTIWMKLGRRTYFVNTYISAKIGTSRFSRLFPAIFRRENVQTFGRTDGRKYGRTHTHNLYDSITPFNSVWTVLCYR